MWLVTRSPSSVFHHREATRPVLRINPYLVLWLRTFPRQSPFYRRRAPTQHGERVVVDRSPCTSLGRRKPYLWLISKLLQILASILLSRSKNSHSTSRFPGLYQLQGMVQRGHIYTDDIHPIPVSRQARLFRISPNVLFTRHLSSHTGCLFNRHITPQVIPQGQYTILPNILTTLHPLLLLLLLLRLLVLVLFPVLQGRLTFCTRKHRHRHLQLLHTPAASSKVNRKRQARLHTKQMVPFTSTTRKTCINKMRRIPLLEVW